MTTQINSTSGNATLSGGSNGGFIIGGDGDSRKMLAAPGAQNAVPVLATGGYMIPPEYVEPVDGHMLDKPIGAITHISDADSATLAGATVSISRNFHPGDVLRFTGTALTGNIGAAYDAATGLLTLTSSGASASLEQWTQALNAVRFVATSEQPGQNTRAFSFVVTDADGNSSSPGTYEFRVTPRNDTPAPAIGLDSVDFGGAEHTLHAAVLINGQLLLTGSSPPGGSGGPLLTRLNSDGSLDTGFGAAGKLADTFISNASGKAAIAADTSASGKTTVLGTDSQHAVLLNRYTANGVADTGFGSGGKLQLQAGSDADFNDVLALPGDATLLVGRSHLPDAAAYDFSIARLNADGSLDTHFGGGLVSARFGGSTGGVATEAILLADGKVLAGGQIQIPSVSKPGAFEYHIALALFNADGTLDTTFDGDGMLSASLPNYTQACVQSLAQQPDGKIVVSGYTVYSDDRADVAPVQHGFLLRFNSDGSADSSFNDRASASYGQFGTNYSVFGTSDMPASMVLQPNGQIVIAGASNGTPSIARFNADGSRDNAFGNDGVLRMPQGFGAEAVSLAQQSDGTLVLAGTAHGDMSVQQIRHDGTPDNTFGAVTYLAGGSPVLLDADSVIYDAELNEVNYDQATLKLVRHGGANAQDKFSALSGGTLAPLVHGGELVVDGSVIGAVTMPAAGTLVLTFNGNATQALVNRAVSQLAYSNNAPSARGTVQIDWMFDDGGSYSGRIFNGSGHDQGPGINTSTGSSAVTITAAPHVTPRDFNGDGKADILLRNSASGQIYQYQMNGTAITGQGVIDTLPPEWRVAGEGDANGDGKSDLLLRNANNGQLYLYMMNGTAIVGHGLIDTQPGWVVAAYADFNGDGKADILLRDNILGNGQLYTYLMNGTAIIGQGVVDALPDWKVAASGDYNGDGKADILMRNSSTGQLYIYLMNGTAIIGQGLLSTLPNWTVAASGDYNGDGYCDILLRNSTTGMIYTYLMVGTTVVNGGVVDTLPESWQIADGVSDFNGDGKSDILLRNTVHGQLYQYQMDGALVTGNGLVDTLPDWNVADARSVDAATVRAANDFNGDGKSDLLTRVSGSGFLSVSQMNGTSIDNWAQVGQLPDWEVAGMGDYNGDGKADILLRNPGNGRLYEYMMNGGAIIGQGDVDVLPGWQVAGSGDFNGDGKSDILLRNISSGRLYEYQMNGSAIIGQGDVDTLPAWQVAGIGDFNGDGKSDILLRQPDSGQLYEYLMDGAAIAGQGVVDILPAWHVAGTGDHNGDGKADILLRNPFTGQIYAYLMNGTTIIGQGMVDTLPTNWQIIDGNSDLNGDGKADILLNNNSTGVSYAYVMAGTHIAAQGWVYNVGENLAMDKKVFAVDSTALVSIRAFSSGYDKIVLKQSAFSAMPAGALAPANFRSGADAQALDGDDYIVYDTSNGKLYYDADGNGAGVAVQIAALVGNPAMSASDIHLQ